MLPCIMGKPCKMNTIGDQIVRSGILTKWMKKSLDLAINKVDKKDFHFDWLDG